MDKLKMYEAENSDTTELINNEYMEEEE